MKTRGFDTNIFSQTTTQKDRLGELRIDDFGRVFRYAKAGGALVAGHANTMAAGSANHIKQVQTSGAANAKGATQVTVYVGATAVTADMYRDGYLQVYDGAAGTVGTEYPITSHTLSAGTGTIQVNIAEPLRVATVVSDTFSLIPNPWNGVTETTTIASPAAGVAKMAVTSGNYFWNQTGGPVCALNQGGSALGFISCLGTTNAGSLQSAADYSSPVIGYPYSFAAVSTKYSPYMLTID